MTNTTTNATLTIDTIADARLVQRLKELASDLADRVSAGEMTELEANEMMVTCQDRWTDNVWG